MRDYARQRGALDTAESFDLVRAERIGIHRFFGCVTLYEYLERVLGYNPHTARERMRVARALVVLPLTSLELTRGTLTYSAVRELTRVATADTERAWLDAAAGKIGREVEALVAGHALGDLPEDPALPDLRTRALRLELPTEVFALLRQARAALEDERGGEVSDADLVETMCRRILDPGTGAAGPAHQIAYKQCADCKRASQNGAGRELDVRADVIERAACDARVIGSLERATPERATTTVTPRMREQVFARDEHRCAIPGCRASRNLDVHHIIEQEAGGPHALWNLTLLCSGHHAALHAGFLKITGPAPTTLHFSWRTAPLPPGLDSKARAEMIAMRDDALMDRIDREGAVTDDDRPSVDGASDETVVASPDRATTRLLAHEYEVFRGGVVPPGTNEAVAMGRTRRRRGRFAPVDVVPKDDDWFERWQARCRRSGRVGRLTFDDVRRHVN